ncbi:hypothetical protein PybrP1_009523 [[Pythium] brassicae (nom. inval.)]|nr:hypothetical protein PybrP1_009523 [[Pythium] brassicae (nom. inval.)]
MATLNLASDQTTLTTTAPAIESGRAFLLKTMTKMDLCVDDGGGTKADRTTITMQLCNPSSMNQLFEYDSVTSQIRSFVKKSLCIQVGVGGYDMKMKSCDPYNLFQRIAVDAAKRQFRNSAKRSESLCFYDRGLNIVGTGFTTWRCDSNDRDQQFGFKYLDQWLTEQTPTGNDAIRAIIDQFPAAAPSDPGRRAFLVKSLGANNLCVGDGGSLVANQSVLAMILCNPNDDNQLFMYDPTTSLVQSSSKANLCMQAGAEDTDMKLQKCDAKNANQKFTYDSVAQTFRSTALKRCFYRMLDLVGAAFNTRVCNTSDKNQAFGVIYQDKVLERLYQPLVDGVTRGNRFMLRTREQCYSSDPSESVMNIGWCDPYMTNQALWWDASTNRIRFVSDRMCVDSSEDMKKRCNDAEQFNFKMMSPRVTVVPPVLQVSKPFQLKNIGTSQCLVRDKMTQKLDPGSCDQGDKFSYGEYGVARYQLVTKKVYGQSLCLDANSSSIEAECNVDTIAQVIEYDPITQTIRNVDQDVCLSFAVSQGIAAGFPRCKANDTNQRFEVKLSS